MPAPVPPPRPMPERLCISSENGAYLRHGIAADVAVEDQIYRGLPVGRRSQVGRGFLEHAGPSRGVGTLGRTRASAVARL